MDFNNLYLSNRDIDILQTLEDGSVATLRDFESEYLLSLNFIQKYALADSNDQYVIDSMGLRYIAFLKKQQFRERCAKFLNYFNTIVSVLAAITAIIALFKK